MHGAVISYDAPLSESDLYKKVARWATIAVDLVGPIGLA